MSLAGHLPALLGVFGWVGHRVMGEELGVGNEAAQVSFPGDWKALLLWAAGKCARAFVSPLVFGFLLKVCSSGSRVIDMGMCLVGGLHCLSLYEVHLGGEQTVKQSLPHGSQDVKDRLVGAGVLVPLHYFPCC